MERVDGAADAAATFALSCNHGAAVSRVLARRGIGMNGTERATAFRHRHDGWTPARQVAFLRTLRETACVRAACAHVGLSSTSAYRVKKRIPDFGAAWDAGLAYRLPALEHAAYTRAVEGWLEPIVYKGAIVGHRRRFSDAMLRLLLLREDARPVPAPGAAPPGRMPADARAAMQAEILRRLAAMDKRRD